MMQVLFQGELPTAAAFALAIIVGAAVAWFYHRETRTLAQPHRWMLPTLRGLAVSLVLLMLAGPTLELRRQYGTIPTINVFVDVSDSMSYEGDDSNASPEQAARSGAAGGSQSSASQPAAVDAAPDRQRSRLDRALKMVLGTVPGSGWIDTVKETHRVKLFAAGGDSTSLIYDSSTPEPPPSIVDASALALDLTRTNLSDNVGARVLGRAIDLKDDHEKETNAANVDDSADGSAESNEGQNEAIVLLSDGQHNSGSSPEAVANRLGDLKIPVFSIGFGRDQEPTDVAVIDVDAPPLVAASGRVAGSLTVKDLARVGQEYQVQIRSGDQVVWSRRLTSESQPTRRVAYDFSIADLVKKYQRTDSPGLDRNRIVLPMEVTIQAVDGEYDATNNSMPFRLSASTRTRRMLIVDSRSRWETRYVRNVFDRDPTWQVETIMLWPDANSLSSLDEAQPPFPSDQKSLAVFDVIVWGDVDANRLTKEQLILVRDFVSQGGGIVFIDGQRDHLYALRNSPLGDLVPVKFEGTGQVTDKMQLSVTPTGAERAAMILLDGGTADENNEKWRSLPAPTMVRQVSPLPGAEVWLEGIRGQASAAPILVARLFGGGQVVYLSTDQTWRWRYRVADTYHAKFWNQLLESIMPPPFDVRDQYVALSTGAPQYLAGEQATIRAQMRDASGNPATELLVDAVVKRDDGRETVVPLRLVDEGRGIYQGQSSALEMGNYTTSVRAAGYSSSGAVTSSFVVAQPPNRENFRLSQNVSLLQSMATASGGVYADESEAQRVWDAIKPLSNGRIEVQKLALAQSFIWFFAVLALLALEWWLRKRVGLI